MIYYSDYDLAFVDILKNGSMGFRTLFTYVMDREPDKPFFIRQPKIYITAVRNPYDRLISQFYHANKGDIWKNWKWTVHHPYFRRWVRDTYKDGYKGIDGHFYSQTRLLQYYENDIAYKIFKMEELKNAHELFFFLPLTKARKAEIDEKYLEILDELQKSTHHATNNIKQGVWQSYYDAKTIEICNKEFENDFKAFGYEMIDPAEFNRLSLKNLL